MSRDIRIRSEYEFAISRNSSQEDNDKAKTIFELEANFSPEQLQEFRRQAEAKVDREDEIGRTAMLAGRVNTKEARTQHAKDLGLQILEAAKEDNEYNVEGYKSFIHEASNVIKLTRDKGENEEQRGA